MIMRSIDTDKLNARIRYIAHFYYEKGRMPTFSEIRDLTGLKSKSTVSKLINSLRKLDVLDKDNQGRLIPKSICYPVKILGTVEAGFPIPAEEELADNISLDKLLIQNPTATFMLKVSGDSMSDAGILPGDMVIVDKGHAPKNSDIVIAEVDGQWTMKYLKKRGDSITLIAANSKYKPIKPKNELKIAGVVTAVIRKYR